MRIDVTVCGGGEALYGEWATQANAIAVECAEAIKGARNHDWAKWVVDALDGGANKAHRWANRPNCKCADLTSPIEGGGFSTNKAKVLEYHSGQWAKKWGGR